MAEANGSNRKLTAWLCALAILVSVGGIWWVGSKQDRVLEAVTTRRGGWVQSFHTEWAGEDGKPYEVTLSGEPGESPASTVARFDEAVKQMESIHPERR